MKRSKKSKVTATEFLASASIQVVRDDFKKIPWDRIPTQEEWEKIRCGAILFLDYDADAISLMEKKLERIKECLERLEEGLRTAIDTIEDELECPFE